MTTQHRSAIEPGPGAASSGAFAVEPAPLFGTRAWAQLRGAVTGFARPIVRWRRERSDVRQLWSLSDTTLKDIGINRGEIFGLVRQRHEDLEHGRHAND